jgi:hypothetical protein
MIEREYPKLSHAIRSKEAQEEESGSAHSSDYA